MALFIQSLPNVKLDLDIVQTNILFHDDWANNVTCRVFTSFYKNIRKLTPPPPPPRRPCYSTDRNHFQTQLSYQRNKFSDQISRKLGQNVTSRAFTCFHYIHIEKNAPPTGGHVFSPIWIVFELVRDINKTNVLTNFNDDWAKIVTSRVFTIHVIQLTGTIFELNYHIKETNVLTKFHDNWAKNVTSRLFTGFHYIHIEKNAPPTGGHVLSPMWTIFELFRDINKTNVLTKFHDDWATIVTSRVFTSHAIELTGTIFELNSHIKETNVLTKFHQNWAKNVTSRVFTCFHYIHIEKNAPPTGGHLFSPIWTIFELVRDINKTNVLTNFHDDWAKIVTSRVFIRKTALPPPGSHVIELTRTIFELSSHIKETNVPTKFHENLAKNKNAPPIGGHVFSPIWTIFELVRDINKTNVLTNFHDDLFTRHVIELTGTIFELNSHIKETNVLTKFHENWAKNVTSRVFKMKTAPPPPSSHVIELTGTIFELYSHIKETNVLTKFHENWAKNVTSRVFTYINKTNVLTNFHDDWAKIVTSRVFTSHVIKLTRTIFELYSHIKETNVPTKFHENWAKNVTSRLFTGFHYIHIEKNAPPTGGHVFSPIWTIFELVQDINKTNVLTNFHDDWATIVTSRVFTMKTAPPHGSHVIELTGTIFEVNSHIKETNVLTKFRENWAKNVTSRVFICFHYIHIEKNAPPTDGHVFSPIWTFFELVLDINKTNVLTNVHDDWAKIVTSRVFISHVIELTRTIFELYSHIKETNVPTKFHENWAKNVTSRVFTCFHYIHIEKNAPPTGGHVFSAIWTIFELVRDINKPMKTAPPTGGHVFQRTGTTFELNQHLIGHEIVELDRDFIGLLTKFHEDRTINVASRVFTNKCGRTDGRRTKTGHKSSPEQSALHPLSVGISSGTPDVVPASTGSRK
ncbi:hypothetical protein DPMN_043168 [Dreissena polymorpha]|uniref:Uncharacterized protein n=1 Tax=Dreissena polymorpha TaxID=45954 RepID=A0A9D4HXN9_DREPO|nr:hypothetical protein DPMN_043168 [Dreissena polymorpha]